MLTLPVRFHVAASDIPVKIIQIYVGQQRREDAALGCSFFGIVKQVIFNVACFQHLTDDFQYTLIMNSDPPQLLHQQTMIDFIKARLDVALDCPDWLIGGCTCGIDHIDNISDRVLLCPVGPETVAVRIKPRLADWFQDDPDAFLNDSVQYCWNTQGTQLSIGFFNVDSSGWHGFVE